MVTYKHEQDALPFGFDGCAVGDRKARDATGQKWPNRQAASLPAPRDVGRHLLQGEERMHLEGVAPRFPAPQRGLAAVPSLEGQRYADGRALLATSGWKDITAIKPRRFVDRYLIVKHGSSRE